MNISDKGLALIEHLEGKRLTTYLDVVGIPTIGVGHTGPEVALGMVITDEQCREFLRDDVADAEACINDAVKVDLTQDQFDSLCSFVFNVGRRAFRESTMLKLINAGDYEGAARQFDRWDRAGGREIPGLLKRRIAEANHFKGEYA